MDDNEARAIFSELRGALETRRGDEAREPWATVLAEVDEEIATGRRILVRVSGDRRAYSERDDETRNPAGGEFMKRVDFTPVEQLEILIESLALATTVPPLLADSFFRLVGDADAEKTPGELILASDAVRDARLAVSRNEAAVRAGEVAELHRLIQVIRAAVRPSERRTLRKARVNDARE